MILKMQLRNENLKYGFSQNIMYRQKRLQVQKRLFAGAKQDGSMVSPGAFIPLFERDGLITRLDVYVFKNVMPDTKRKTDAGKTIFPSFNKSVACKLAS